MEHRKTPIAAVRAAAPRLGASGEREGSWRLLKAVGNNAFPPGGMSCGHDPTKQNWQRVRARTGQHHCSIARIEPGVCVRIQRGRQGSIVIRRSHIDAMRNVAMQMLTGELTIGHSDAVHMQAVAMWLAMVMTRRRRRQVMIGANRTVQQDSKRCDDRQSGRKRPDHRMDRLYHQAPIHVAFTTSSRWPLTRPERIGP